MGVTLLIFVLLPLLPQSPDPDAIPPESGVRPAGSSNEAVLAAVSAGLESCAQARVLRPANCPQKVDDLVGQADEVHWAIHGDPVDGAYAPVWSNDRFYVAGNAVMTATYQVPYQVPSPENLTVEVVPYRAEVTWTDGKATIGDLRSFDRIDKQRISKREPRFTPEQVTAVVRTAFHRCVAGTRSPMPPECPSWSAAQQSDHATWTLNGDPLVNSKQTFESSTGMVHVTGSYSATVSTHDQFLGMDAGYKTTQSGDYDASVIVDGPELHVLQIKSA
ncbi:hypothetical protein AB0J55_33395 [Amycolatopsis sp. NPDC049688]|uniref:hypothetical protein n=1 Tax=Amycolatopsis sp. NPDC049688 TaxID=3154733 RepID=UPI003414F6F4